MIIPAIAHTMTAATRMSKKLRWMPMSEETDEETSTWTRALKKKLEPNQPIAYAPSA